MNTKLHLDTTTLEIIDCVNIKRALKAIRVTAKDIIFSKIKLLTSSSAMLYVDINKLVDSISTYINQEIVIVELESPIRSITEYSKFMIRNLIDYIDTEHVLCIQWDAFVLNHNAWNDAFLKYDFVGAPWWFNDDNNVGNGGFSLRTRKFLYESSKLPIRNFHPEDLILCRTYKNLLLSRGITWAPESLACKFSIEGNQKYGRKWQSQFGFHDFEMTDISSWVDYSEFIGCEI